MDQIYKQFRIIRKQKGYTLKTLSEITGIPFQRISEIEKGQAVPKQEYKEKLEQVLGVNLFDDTLKDQEISDLFDSFYSKMFYGNLNITELADQVNYLYENALDSKYHYLTFVMKYAFEVMNANEKVLDDRNLKNIDFDRRAYHIYQIYKAKSLYERKNLVQAKELLMQVIANSLDEKIQSIAQYQLIFIWIDEYQLLEASSLIEKAKRTFIEYGAFLRVHECNLHQAHICACEHRYAYAVELYEKCVCSALSMNLPPAEIARIYREIAIYSIFDGNYTKALQALDLASALEENNEDTILYYLYVYYYIHDLEKFRYWLLIAKELELKGSLKIELEFWQLISKKQFISSAKVIEKANKIYDYYAKEKDYERLFFYTEIILSLYDQINDVKNKYMFIEKEKEILAFIYDS